MQGGYAQPFPFLFGGAFIEANQGMYLRTLIEQISLPFWRGFH